MLSAARFEPGSRSPRRADGLAFVAGALVTPPDPITQVLAFPPLFAGSFVVSYLFLTQRVLTASGETAA